MKKLYREHAFKETTEKEICCQRYENCLFLLLLLSSLFSVELETNNISRLWARCYWLLFYLLKEMTSCVWAYISWVSSRMAVLLPAGQALSGTQRRLSLFFGFGCVVDLCNFSHLLVKDQHLVFFHSLLPLKLGLVIVLIMLKLLLSGSLCPKQHEHNTSNCCG